MSDDEFKKLQKIEQMARDNRAMIVLAVVLSPLVVFLIFFITFFSLDLQFNSGELKELNLKSREITVPAEIKMLVSIFGLGGLLGLSKEQIIKMIFKDK